MLENLVHLGIPKLLVVFIVSMLPIVELRGALPVAINIFHIPWYFALPIALAGNLAPVPALLLSLDRVRRASAKMGIVGKALEWFFNQTRRRGSFIERYGPIGLVLFVAIPLPGTGAWTGSIAAFLFGIKFRDAFLPICLGVLLAGIIVTALCILGWIGGVIAGVGLGALIISSLWPRHGKQIS